MARVVEKILKVIRVAAAMLLKFLENLESVAAAMLLKILEDGSRLHAPG